MPAQSLSAPLAVLLADSLLFHPRWAGWLPRVGWGEALVSPQLLYIAASAWLLRGCRPPAASTAVRRVAAGLGLALAAGALVGAATALRLGLPEAGPPAARCDASRLLLVLALAPLGEELFFRGALLPALAERMPKAAALLLSSILFMFRHGGWLAPGALLMGLIAGGLRLRTGSVLPGMGFHAGCNAYGPALAAWAPGWYRALRPFFEPIG